MFPFWNQEKLEASKNVQINLFIIFAVGLRKLSPRHIDQ